MLIKTDQLIREIKHPDSDDPLVIRPLPDIDEIERSGSAAIDLRLGCWFMTFRHTRLPYFDIYKKKDLSRPSEARLTKQHFVPFGEEFVLHPKAFVLGVTLEWIRLPGTRAGYVVGRSSWGRHGLIIATATGVHPGFTGCLTLELTNVGEIPIVIKPAARICQLFLHQVDAVSGKKVDRSKFFGMRRPTLGTIELDQVAEILSEPIRP